MLREQDGEWESTRSKELGKDVILGPNTSPIKRQNEQLKGAPVIKQRWKKLNHNVIQEQLESYQNNREQLMENKLLLPHRNRV